MDLHVFPIPIPIPTSLSTRSLWVFPAHQARALVSCIQPGLVICFTIDNIHAVLLNANIVLPYMQERKLRLRGGKWSTFLRPAFKAA